MPQLAFEKIDDEGTTLGGNVNQTPSGRIVRIMVLDLGTKIYQSFDQGQIPILSQSSVTKNILNPLNKYFTHLVTHYLTREEI